jgi:hypothetical protein
MAETKLAGTGPAPSLYESDFYRWTETMADRLRKRDVAALDWENLTEEVEDLGRSVKREIRSRLIVLIAHLLKWQYQPELREGSTWKSTIREQRNEVAYLLEESPSLKPKVQAMWAGIYRRAVGDAAYDMHADERSLPVSCPYSLEQVLDLKFLPE